MKSKLAIVLFICVFTIIGCSNNAIDERTSSPEVNPDPLSSKEGYPLKEPTMNSETAYPINNFDPGYKKGPEFHFTLPVLTNDQVVTGTGPINVPIILVDVSEMGLILAATTIKEDGSFIFVLDEPLQSGHVIGLQLGDLEGTGIDKNDFLFSDTYYERPLIGTFFDLTTVEQ